MAQSKINQMLKRQLDELTLLETKNNVPIRFIVDKTPFDEDEVNDPMAPEERIIIGRIFPNSNIFNQGAFQIEIKLSASYPCTPPKVRFLTPIYHPNVSIDGAFTHERLQQTARWTPTTTLFDVIKAVIDRIDQPDIDYSLNNDATTEYTNNRDQFNVKALELIKRYALPRNLIP